GTKHLRGAHGPIKSRPICADDREVVGALDPKLSEPNGKCAHLVQNLRPGPALPDAEVLEAVGCAIPELARVAQEKLGKRICTSGIGGHRVLPLDHCRGNSACGAVCRHSRCEYKKLDLPGGQGPITRYSAAFRSGGAPARNASKSAASSALAALR